MKFACPSCGKQYTWKPALAGKKAKCTCGGVISVPLTESAEPAEADDLYDLADQPAPAAAPARPRPAATATMPAPAPAAPQAPAYVPPVTRTKRAAQDESSGNTGKVLAGVGIIVLLGIGATVGGMFLSKHHGPGKSSRPMLADDQYVEDQLNDGVSGEVKQWIDGNQRRMVMGMTNSQAKGLADNFYAHGAKKVVAFGPMMSVSLAVELPDDPAKRTWFFDYEHENHNDITKALAKDIGQKWILMRMHP